MKKFKPLLIYLTKKLMYGKRIITPIKKVVKRERLPPLFWVYMNKSGGEIVIDPSQITINKAIKIMEKICFSYHRMLANKKQSRINTRRKK